MHVCVAIVCLSPPAPRLELYYLSCLLPRHQQRTTPVASKAAPTRRPTAPAAYSPLSRSKDRGTSHRPQGCLRTLSDQFLFSPAQRMWSPAERTTSTASPPRRTAVFVPWSLLGGRKTDLGSQCPLCALRSQTFLMRQLSLKTVDCLLG
jgi:hypothetical protein